MESYGTETVTIGNALTLVDVVNYGRATRLIDQMYHSTGILEDKRITTKEGLLGTL